MQIRVVLQCEFSWPDINIFLPLMLNITPPMIPSPACQIIEPLLISSCYLLSTAINYFFSSRILVWDQDSCQSLDKHIDSPTYTYYHDLLWTVALQPRNEPHLSNPTSVLPSWHTMQTVHSPTSQNGTQSGVRSHPLNIASINSMLFLRHRHHDHGRSLNSSGAEEEGKDDPSWCDDLWAVYGIDNLALTTFWRSGSRFLLKFFLVTHYYASARLSLFPAKRFPQISPLLGSWSIFQISSRGTRFTICGRKAYDYTFSLRRTMASTYPTGLYVFLQVAGGQVGLPLFVVTMLVSSKVKRHLTLINFCWTWIVYSIVYCLTYVKVSLIQPSSSDTYRIGSIMARGTLKAQVGSFVLYKPFSHME